MIRSLPRAAVLATVLLNAAPTAAKTWPRIAQQGMIVSPMDVKTFDAFVGHEASRWKPVILKARIKMD